MALKAHKVLQVQWEQLVQLEHRVRLALLEHKVQLELQAL